jgi:antitoxin MazE6
MKTAISIPDSIFRKAEELSEHLGVSRSALFTRAIKDLIDRYQDERITEQLNAVYLSEPSSLEPALAKLARKSLRKMPW